MHLKCHVWEHGATNKDWHGCNRVRTLLANQVESAQGYQDLPRCYSDILSSPGCKTELKSLGPSQPSCFEGVCVRLG